MHTHVSVHFLPSAGGGDYSIWRRTHTGGKYIHVYVLTCVHWSEDAFIALRAAWQPLVAREKCISVAFVQRYGKSYRQFH